jgi:hypothetical protein
MDLEPSRLFSHLTFLGAVGFNFCEKGLKLIHDLRGRRSEKREGLFCRELLTSLVKGSRVGGEGRDAELRE